MLGRPGKDSLEQPQIASSARERIRKPSQFLTKGTKAHAATKSLSPSRKSKSPKRKIQSPKRRVVHAPPTLRQYLANKKKLAQSMKARDQKRVDFSDDVIRLDDNKYDQNIKKSSDNSFSKT